MAWTGRLRSGCSGKVRHETPEAALLALKATLRETERPQPRPLHIYRCACGGYHVGHYRKAKTP